MAELRRLPLGLGIVLLVAAWAGPLPRLAASHFTAHMSMHMAVVAVAAPLLAMAIAGHRLDPSRRWPRLFAPLPAAFAELIVVWGWHAPVAHQAARSNGTVLLVEQATFLLAGIWLFLAAFGGEPEDRSRAASGVVALLLTSAHMTLLGALLGLGWRPLYAPHGHDDSIAPSLVQTVTDQQLGGAIMLLVGGVVYLTTGLGLTARLLRDTSPRRAA